MLGAVTYTFQNQHYEVYFNQLSAKLPVKLKSGAVTLLPWGRRKNQPGKLPYGGSIHLDSIYAGLINAYQPRPVKLQINDFMIYDFDNRPHWYDAKSSLSTLQGIVIRKDHEQRVYMVVIQPNQEVNYHSIWPRFII